MLHAFVEEDGRIQAETSPRASDPRLPSRVERPPSLAPCAEATQTPGNGGGTNFPARSPRARVEQRVSWSDRCKHAEDQEAHQSRMEERDRRSGERPHRSTGTPQAPAEGGHWGEEIQCGEDQHHPWRWMREPKSRNVTGGQQRRRREARARRKRHPWQ